jgi:biotin carboxylase
MVIEIAARLSGGDLCESIVPLSSGVNYVRSVIRLALGEEPDWRELEPKFTRHVANRYFFPAPGRLLAIEGAEAVRAQPWVKKLAFAYRPGDVVPPATSHATRAGVFVVVAEEREALERRVAWVYRTLRLVTESDATVRAA